MYTVLKITLLFLFPENTQFYPVIMINSPKIAAKEECWEFKTVLKI